MKHEIGDKAIAKVGIHIFKVGEELTFQGMDYDEDDLETYVFKNQNGYTQYLTVNEFKWK